MRPHALPQAACALKAKLAAQMHERHAKREETLGASPLCEQSTVQMRVQPGEYLIEATEHRSHTGTVGREAVARGGRRRRGAHEGAKACKRAGFVVRQCREKGRQKISHALTIACVHSCTRWFDVKERARAHVSDGK